YTLSDMYPYSSRSLMPGTGKEVNYIRNSVKVVIDAYIGNVDFYTLDESDPVLNTYKSIFPGLFKPFSEMSEELKKHIRYPKNLFSIQVDAYLKYHMEDTQVFYNQEDLWQLPNEIYGDIRLEMEPYYIIIKLPDEDKEEFFLLLPMTPSRKDNMIGWLAARCDLPDYGNLIVYKLPKDKLVYGPMQIEARVNQQTEISREFSLWDQRGSRVVRGNMLAIPVEDSFIYIEPVYLEAKQDTPEKASPMQQSPRGAFSKPQAGTQGGTLASREKPAISSASLPELKRIIAASGNKVVMHEKLDGALKAILGDDLPEITAAYETSDQIKSGAPLTEIAGKALEHYRRAKEYLKEDNWAGYGMELNELEKILAVLQEKTASKDQ
ncbi:MAG: COG1615 family transporter, partial [Deltaproteobacteria bacterium]|nr:COG1615 family transporter [Deltaproteobacteria bacterium]